MLYIKVVKFLEKFKYNYYSPVKTMKDTLNVGFYLAPGAETKDTYTDRLLVDESKKRGHKPYVFNNFTFFDNKAYGLMNDGECLLLTDLNLLFLRKEDMDKNDWQDMERLTHFSEKLPPTINTPKFILGADKKYMKPFSEFTPETYFTTSIQEGIEKANYFGKAILKPIQGRSGQGIELVDTKNLSQEKLKELIEGMITTYQEIVVQDYVPGVVRGDKRVLVLNGEPIGAFLRLPEKGGYKCNIYAGGSAHPTEITDLEREIIKATSSRVIPGGGLFTGYDFMYKNHTGDDVVLTEINGTAVGGVQQANQFLKPGEEPLEKIIIDYVEELVG